MYAYKILILFSYGINSGKINAVHLQKFLRVVITVGGDNPEKDTINEIATLKLIETYC